MGRDEKVMLNKTYNWEDVNDLERDIEEAGDRIADMQNTDEWKGEIRVTITYIP